MKKASNDLEVRPVIEADRGEWLRMRTLLWPDCPEEHPPEIDTWLARRPMDQEVFVAARGDDRLGGFLECGARAWAEGCRTGPVGYIEGWWVDPDLRRHGVGAALLRAAERWAQARGYSEMASDADVANDVSHAAHGAAGYEEVGRAVLFRKSLGVYTLPWAPIDRTAQPAFERELRRELPKGHALFGKAVRAIARRVDRDDVLFEVGGGPRVATVRLTYREETDPARPVTNIHESFEAFRTTRMREDADEEKR